MKAGSYGKRQKNRGRERLKVKTSPPGMIGRERLKIRLSLTKQKWRGTQKNSLSLTKRRREGNTEIQSSPCGGEDTTPKGVNISPSVARRLRG